MENNVSGIIQVKQPTVMSYLLGIVIDGARVKDEDARLICFLFYGLTYPETGDCMDYETSTVRNHVHDLYGDLGVPAEVQSLLRKCYDFGFDMNGHFNGREVLTKADRNRMYRIAPRTKNK